MYRNRAINWAVAAVMAVIMILGVNPHNIWADTIDDTFIEKAHEGQDMIISFASLGTDVSYQVVPHGTGLDELNLPTALSAMIEVQIPAESHNQDAGKVEVTWEVTSVILTYAEDDIKTELAFNGFVAGTYSFTAVIPFGFVMAEGIILPQITVVVASAETTPADIMPVIGGVTNLQDAIGAAPTDDTPTTITLTSNIILDGALTIDQNRNIILDGNGFTITQTTTGQRHFNVGVSAANLGMLTLRDITLNGGTMTDADRLVAGSTGTVNRGGIVVNIGSSLVVENAIIENNRAAGAGGINSSGTVTLLSGAIIRHNTGGMGGGVYTSTGAAVTHMHPGSYISHNSATHAGGIGGMGLLEMHGGTISFNRAAANGAGGGIMSWTSRAGSPSLIMHDGVIEGNLAQVGGGIAFLGTSAAAAGENAITGIIHGGEIINNGRMAGFADTVQGGGIFLQGWARLAIHDVTVRGNFASGGGGGIMASSGANPVANPPITTLNIIEGLIDDNASGASGGGIMLTSSTTNAGSAVATLGAGVIVSNNNAPNGSGGGIAMANITAANTTMLTINGSTIRGNTAGSNGGGIAIWPSPRQALSMPSGFVQRNTGLNGGGIFTGDISSIAIGSPVIFSCNVATNGAVHPPAALPANVATTSSTIFNHSLNNFDINLDGAMITNLSVRFYSGANGDFAAPNTGDAHVERLIPVTTVCDPPPLVVPGIDADSGWIHTGWQQNGNTNAPLLSSADIVALDIRDNISFTAQYSSISFTVAFDLNDGEYAGNPALLSQSVLYGGDADALTQNPTRTGYVFSGWSPALNLSNVTEDRAFTALWNPEAYKVSVMAPPEPEVKVTILVDGVPSDGNNILPGSSVSIEISRPGFSFSRWRVTGLPNHILDSIEDFFIYFEMPPGNLVFHPHWAGDIRASNLGAGPNIDAPHRLKPISGAGYEIRQHVEVGERVYLRSPGNRPGYVFNGWEAVNPPDLIILPSTSHFFIMPDIGSVGFGFEYIEVRALWRASDAVTSPGNNDESENNYDGNNSNQHTASPTTQTATPVSPITTPLTKEQPTTATLITDVHIRYVTGYPDGTFRQDGSITRAEVAQILFNLIDDDTKFAPIASEAVQFDDVSATQWYSQAINYLAWANILNGYSDGTFRPNVPMTRAELTAVMSHFFEFASGHNTFPDIADHWAYRYINSGFNRGWIYGYPDGTFKADNSITRAETVTIVNRVLNRHPNPATIDYHVTFYLFSDLSRHHWAYYQIMEAAIEHEFKYDAYGNEIWIYLRY